MATSFEGKHVLITGASSGIGVELARLFAKDGAIVGLVARREDRLNTLAASLSERDRPAPLVIVADVSQPEECDRIMSEARAAWGRVDVLVNNAGLGDLGEMHTVSQDALQRMIDVNITALTRLSRSAAVEMAARREGWILNVASVAAFTPIPLMAVYAATKAYVLSVSESMHDELGRHGVVVSCLCPGTTRTEFFERGGFENHRDLILKMCATPQAVARLGFDMLRRGKMTRMHGVISNVQTFIMMRLFPRRLTAWVVGKAIRAMRS